MFRQFSSIFLSLLDFLNLLSFVVQLKIKNKTNITCFLAYNDQIFYHTCNAFLHMWFNKKHYTDTNTNTNKNRCKKLSP